MAQISSVHIVLAGETLSQIAKKHKVSLDDLLEANQQIQNPNLIKIGQPINIPSLVAQANTQSPAGPPILFDGIHPAPGTTVANQAKYSTPPLTNTELNRAPASYDQVINQFAVGNNPRHLKFQGNTFCNIFLWDVTRAMGAEIPHWVSAKDEIAIPFSEGAREITINAGVDWLQKHGPSHGWQLTTDKGAQDNANLGKPAVVVWKNPIIGGHGHTAVIRPGSLTVKGPIIAQAGGINFNMGHLKDGFGTKSSVKYYRHD
ncbi:WXG100 family type VII secretion target [Spirosoma horti]